MEDVKQITTRIRMAKEGFVKKKESLSRNMNIQIKITKTMVWGVVVYVSEM